MRHQTPGRSHRFDQPEDTFTPSLPHRGENMAECGKALQSISPVRADSCRVLKLLDFFGNILYFSNINRLRPMYPDRKAGPQVRHPARNKAGTDSCGSSSGARSWEAPDERLTAVHLSYDPLPDCAAMTHVRYANSQRCGLAPSRDAQPWGVVDVFVEVRLRNRTWISGRSWEQGCCCPANQRSRR